MQDKINRNTKIFAIIDRMFLVLAVMVFAGAIGYRYFHFNSTIREIKKYKSFTIGRIEKYITVRYVSKGSINNAYYIPGHIYFIYSFSVDGKTYSGEKYEEVKPDQLWRFENGSFPIIYSGKDPGKNVILITPNSFSLFKIPFPDSLSWVKSCEIQSPYNKMKNNIQFWNF